MNNKTLKDKLVLLSETILTVLGFILAWMLLYRTIKTDLSVLSLLVSNTYLFAYLVLMIYATNSYKKEGDIYFKFVIYSYVALLGVQILQAGNFISNYGLDENIVLIINICNLFCYAGFIKFADSLNVRKVALIYGWITVLIKFGIELGLIISMFAYIKLIHIITSLSVPILGATIMLAYINREKRLSINK